MPEPGIQPTSLGVVVNDLDPLSRQIGDYYLLKHEIPRENLFHVALDPGAKGISAAQFDTATQQLRNSLPDRIQGLVLTWMQPYVVKCMSMTSAFTFGFDEKYCASKCNTTAVNNYARASSLEALSKFGIRPSMMLAADSLEEAKALIDRGASSRGWHYRHPDTRPAAWLVETSDKARSVRKSSYPEARHRFAGQLEIHVENSEAVENQRDILFYFTGSRWVPGITSNRYLPGAAADHLTSAGGQLSGGRQMSAVEWLQAGATGSYGTVTEPCNFTAKFPHPPRMIEQYLAGRTLLEAYWKSVLMPGQGVFIGDPLAAPYLGYRIEEKGGDLTVHTSQLLPGHYQWLAADSALGPFRPVGVEIELGSPPHELPLPNPLAAFYKLQPVD